MRFGFAVAAALTAVLLPSWGCGRNEGRYVAPTVPVKGKVTYRGQPLKGGTVFFEPEFGPKASGSINADGTFELTTFKPGDGTVAGTHRVAVVGTTQNGRPVPVKYRNVSSSAIEFEVSDGKTDYPIDLN